MSDPSFITRRRLLASLAGLLALGSAACASPTPTPSPTVAAAAPAPKPAEATAAPKPASPVPKPAATAAPQPTVAPKPIQPVKWRVGFSSSPFFDSVYRTIGIKQGFYRDAGIDVEYVHAQAQNQIRAFIAGELQSVDLGIASILAAAEQGAPVKIVGSVLPGVGFAVYARKEVQTMADLAGRSVGVSAPGDYPHTVIRALLAKAGVPEDRVTIVPLGQSGAPMIQALVLGKIDAFTNPVDYVDAVQADPNLRVVAFVPDVVPDLVRAVIAVRTVTGQQQGDAVVRYLTAVMRSVRYVHDHKTEAVAEAEELTKLPRAQLEFLYDWNRDHKTYSVNLYLDPKKLDYTQDLLVRLGEQKQRMPNEQILDLSFQKQVIAQLGEVKE